MEYEIQQWEDDGGAVNPNPFDNQPEATEEEEQEEEVYV